MSHDVIDCEDIVMPPRFVDAWGKPRRSGNKDDKLMVTFQMTTIEERQTLFPSPRLVDEPMSIKDFGRPLLRAPRKRCFEGVSDNRPLGINRGARVDHPGRVSCYSS